MTKIKQHTEFYNQTALVENTTLKFEEIDRLIQFIISPRLIACVAGVYPDDSEHCLSIEQAKTVIRVTRTNGCSIHIPTQIDNIPQKNIPILELIEAFVEPMKVVPLLNTSRASDAIQARQIIDYGLQIFDGPLHTLFQNPPLIKLEVLDQNFNVAEDEVIRCIKDLPSYIRYRTIPLLAPSPQIVYQAVELGCRAIRLMSGVIGKPTGILNPKAVNNAISAAENRPVILEGGINKRKDIIKCSKLGAQAVLINSVFRHAKNSEHQAILLRKAADEAWY